MNEGRSLDIAINLHKGDRTGYESAKKDLGELSGSLEGLTPETRRYVEQVKAMGKEGGEAHEKIHEGAHRAHMSHRELNMALRQLGPEFQHLGHLATHVLHGGILAPILLIGAAVEIWKTRMETAAKTLGEFELPEVFKNIPGELSAAAEAFQLFNDKLKESVEKYSSADEANKRYVKTLAEELKAKKELLEVTNKLGMTQFDMGKLSKEERANEIKAKEDHEKKLIQASKVHAKESADIKLGTVEQENRIDEQYKKNAEEAEKSQKERKARLADLYGAKDMTGSVSERAIRGMKLLGRYGARASDPEELDKIIKEEEEGGESEKRLIEAYEKRMRGKPERERLAKKKAELAKTSADEAAEALKIEQELPEEKAAAARADTAQDRLDRLQKYAPQAQADIARMEALAKPGTKMIGDEAMGMQTMASQIAGRQVDLKTALAMFQKAAQSKQAENADIEKLVELAAKSVEHIAKLTGKVAQMDAQLKGLHIPP